MSASDLVNRFGFDVTVTRYAASTYVNGRIQAGAASTFTAKMSIQPLNGRELLNLPEAQRAKQMAKAYTDVELRTVNEVAKTKADRISDGTRVFEVQAVEAWQSSGNSIAPHWKVLLAEVNP